jgi:phosphoglycerol transferase MdoB-like AlkP superfamily enzyme
MTTDESHAARREALVIEAKRLAYIFYIMVLLAGLLLLLTIFRTFVVPLMQLWRWLRS